MKPNELKLFAHDCDHARITIVSLIKRLAAYIKNRERNNITLCRADLESFIELFHACDRFVEFTEFVELPTSVEFCADVIASFAMNDAQQIRETVERIYLRDFADPNEREHFRQKLRGHENL